MARAERFERVEWNDRVEVDQLAGEAGAKNVIVTRSNRHAEYDLPACTLVLARAERFERVEWNDRVEVEQLAGEAGAKNVIVTRSMTYSARSVVTQASKLFRCLQEC